MTQSVKSLPAMQETPVRFLGWEDPLEKEMATQSRILAWRMPWTEETGRLQSMRFSRQECWSGLPFPSPEDLPNPGIKPGSPALEMDSLPTELKYFFSLLYFTVMHRIVSPKVVQINKRFC